MLFEALFYRFQILQLIGKNDLHALGSLDLCHSSNFLFWCFVFMVLTEAVSQLPHKTRDDRLFDFHFFLLSLRPK